MLHLKDEGVDANKGGRGVGVRERLIRTTASVHEIRPKIGHLPSIPKDSPGFHRGGGYGGPHPPSIEGTFPDLTPLTPPRSMGSLTHILMSGTFWRLARSALVFSLLSFIFDQTIVYRSLPCSPYFKQGWAPHLQMHVHVCIYMFTQAHIYMLCRNGCLPKRPYTLPSKSTKSPPLSYLCRGLVW